MGDVIRLPILGAGPPESGTILSAKDRRRERGWRKRKTRPRSQSFDRVSQIALEADRALFSVDELDAADAAMPKTRGDCANVVRPCPHVRCRFSLHLDVHPRTGSLKRNFPDLDPTEMPPTGSCALDVAENNGPQTLEEIGVLLNITRERARQLVDMAIRKLTHHRKAIEYMSEDPIDSAPSVISFRVARSIEADAFAVPAEHVDIPEK